MRLTVLGVKDTARILQPEFLYLSPTIGLLLGTSSHLIRNFCRIHELTYGSNGESIAVEFYYQRFSKINQFQTVGNINLSGSKSRPSYWLTSGDIGALLGFAISNETQIEINRLKISNSLEKKTNRLFESMGIECNHLRGEWTGISLERYRKLIRTIAIEYNQAKQLKHPNMNQLPSLSIAILLRAMWEKSNDKMNLLQYLRELENKSQKIVFRSEYEYLRKDDDKKTIEWLESKFSFQELSSDRVLASIKTVLNHEANHIDKMGECMEIVSAGLMMDRGSIKPPIKLGRYMFGEKGSKLKPDCVEVVIREIFDMLLYDVELQRLDWHRLPSTAHPSLRNFYEKYCESQLERGLNQEYEKIMGQEWFHLCSAIPKCEYLSWSYPNSQGQEEPYELRPLLSNVSRVVGYLFNLSHDWTSLTELETFWNQLQLSSPSGRQEIIQIKQRIVSFRAAHSDTEQIFREVATIQFSKTFREIELELEDKHGLATVKHRKMISKVDPIDHFHMTVFNHFAEHVRLSSLDDPIRMDHNTSSATFIQILLYSTILNENISRSYHNFLPTFSKQSETNDCQDFVQAVTWALICSRWGADREHMLFDVDVRNGEIIYFDGAILDNLKAARNESSEILLLHALRKIKLVAERCSANKESAVVNNMKRLSKCLCFVLEGIIQHSYNHTLTTATAIEIIAVVSELKMLFNDQMVYERVDTLAKIIIKERANPVGYLLVYKEKGFFQFSDEGLPKPTVYDRAFIFISLLLSANGWKLVYESYKRMYA